MEGKTVPYAVFIGREGDIVPKSELDGGCPIGGRFVELTSEQVFKGKRVVVFALPGAWTPTCSSQQLPGFEAAYDDFKAAGIDEVYCLSVNDGFVMNSWFEAEGVKNVKALCDGNGEFTKGMGMLVDKSNLGFGHRSWRYAMVVNDGVIEKMFVEPGMTDLAADDPYAVSSAASVRGYL